MGRIMEAIISVCRGVIKAFFLRMSGGAIQMGKMVRCYSNVDLRLRKNSSISIGNHVSIGKRTVLSALNGGKILLGNRCGVGMDCKIVSHEGVSGGENTILGPGVIIYDHDHVYGPEGVMHKEFQTKPVNIGKNCWIGAYSVILKGTIIGENCVIGAGCIVKGEIPDGTVLVQKRENTIINVVKT